MASFPVFFHQKADRKKPESAARSDEGAKHIIIVMSRASYANGNHG